MSSEKLAEFCSDSNNIGSSACTCYFQLQSIQDEVEEKTLEFQEATDTYNSMKSTWDSAYTEKETEYRTYWLNQTATGDCTVAKYACSGSSGVPAAFTEVDGYKNSDCPSLIPGSHKYKCKLPTETIDSYVLNGGKNKNNEWIDGMKQWVIDNPEPSPPNDYTPEIDAACCANEISNLTNVNASNVVQNCEASIANDYISDSGEAIDNPTIENTLDTCYTDSGCSGFLMQCDTDSSTCKRNNMMLGLIIGASSLIIIIIIVVVILLLN